MIDYFCDAGVGTASSQRCLYLVFEYMDTSLWHEFVRRKGLFDRQLCVRIFTDICRGVQHLHDLCIVHTDLSSTNILYSQGTAKVADLGCSHSADTWKLPISKSEKGTPHSRSPELWLAAGTQDTACSQLPDMRSSPAVQTSAFAPDLWSLGVCLGMLLTGQYIFEDFAQIIACLGPLTDAEWMGCLSLPGYATLKVAELSARVAADYKPVTDFFSSDQHVRYPKPPRDSGIALIRMLLKWSPPSRCTVRQALGHEFCGFQPDEKEVAEAIRQCTFEELGQLVFDSITGSAPVLATALMGVPSLGRFKRYRGHEARGELVAEDEIDGECGSDPLCKRPRKECARVHGSQKESGDEAQQGEIQKRSGSEAPCKRPQVRSAGSLQEHELSSVGRQEPAGSQGLAGSERPAGSQEHGPSSADSQKHERAEQVASQELASQELVGSQEHEPTQPERGSPISQTTFTPLDASLCGCRGLCRSPACLHKINQITYQKKKRMVHRRSSSIRFVVRHVCQGIGSV